MDKDLKEKIKQSLEETGFSIKGFSRREFIIMAIICQEVLQDEYLLETVNPLSKFKGLELELSALSDKLAEFLGE